MNILFILSALVVGIIVGGGAMYIYKNAIIRAKDDAFDLLREAVDSLEDMLEIEDEDE